MTITVEDLDTQDQVDGIEQQVVGAVVEIDGRVLLLRRTAGDFLGGLWELPSGKVEPGEDLAVALRREVHEETGLNVDEAGGYLGSFDYVSGSGRLSRQHTWVVRCEPGEIVLSEHDAHRLVEDGDDWSVSDEVGALLKAYFG